MGSEFTSLKDLQKATRDYVAKERERLHNEVTVLRDILSKRGSASGLADNVVTQASTAAEKDLAAYLLGD